MESCYGVRDGQIVEQFVRTENSNFVQVPIGFEVLPAEDNNPDSATMPAQEIETNHQPDHPTLPPNDWPESGLERIPPLTPVVIEAVSEFDPKPVEPFNPEDPPLPDNYCTYPMMPTQIQDQLVTFFIEGRKNRNGIIYPDITGFTVEVFHPAGHPCEINVELDTLCGARYRCTFQADQVGVYKGYARLGPENDVSGSPFKFFVSRNYLGATARTIFSPGSRGKGLHQEYLKRCSQLWGIDIDRSSGRIYVADKGADRIRIYSPEGYQIAEIGKRGRGCSQFYRPTDIAVDHYNNRVIVSDKNRNRICFLTMSGQFISAFGKKGLMEGQLLAPWGVAVSPNGNIIAVADSRNHRIQLFDKNGIFMNKYSIIEFAPYEYKDLFDYPRGICFDNSGEFIFVSDYSLNAVFVFDKDLTNKKILVPPGQLNGPSGIAVDPSGNILICDTNNNCIRVVNPYGNLSFSIYGGDANFERPQDVAVLPGGYVAIVDGRGDVRVY